jgi:degradative hydroxymethylglutaryl-CoA reductase
VIAAASAAAKLIKRFGGFKAHSTDPIMIGQIQVLDIDPKVFHGLILEREKELITKANTKYCPRMVKRGGGVVSLQFLELNSKSGVVEISVNVGEAMGANIVNTICEGLAQDLQLLAECRLGLRILSNYCPDRKAISEFRIPVKELAYKSIPGAELAKRFIESWEFAKFSVNRACTHNKGILNGVIAVCLATGQDTRAVESAAHSWAAQSGRYQPLNSYKIESGMLVGRIELPIAIGTAGGALKTNPGYQGSMMLLGNPSSNELGQLIASVGLASNFAAIRAMVSEGINKGHMGLHAKNIAVSAGVPSSIVSEVVEYMKQRGDISQKAALDYMSAHHIHTISRKSFKQQGALNTFHISLLDQKPPVSFTLAFTCPKISGVHVDLRKSSRSQMAVNLHKLFVRKDYQWLDSFVRIIEKVRFKPENPRNNQTFLLKMKLFAIWINEISIHLVNLMGSTFCDKVFTEVFAMRRDTLEKLTLDVEEYVEFGIYMAYELYHVLNFNLENFDNSPIENSAELAQRIRKEVQLVVLSNIKSMSVSPKDYHLLVELRKKQMSATLMLYCDCLGVDTINIQLLNNLQKLGDILEILSTARRDYMKSLNGEAEHPNIYKAWKEQEMFEGSYFSYFERLVKTKSQQLPPDMIELVRKTVAFMNGYYKKYPQDSLDLNYPKL